MTYDASLLKLHKLSFGATLGYGFVLGRSALGQAVDVRSEVPVSAASLTDGYSIGAAGELSIDPATGAATMTERFKPLRGADELVQTSTRTNLVTNPSFETNTTGWGSSVATLTRDTSTPAVGIAALKSTANATTFSGNSLGHWSSANVAVPGTTYTASVYLKTASAGQKLVRVMLRFMTDAFVVVQSFQTDPFLLPESGWPFQRYSVTATAPATSSRLAILVICNGTYAAGDAVYIDGAMIEASSTLGSYFDGTTAGGAAWTGTAHASTSTLPVFSAVPGDLLPPDEQVPSLASAALLRGDRVELTYAESVLLQGIVYRTTTTLDAEPAGGFTRRTNYELRSLASELLNREVSWSSLVPVENEAQRLLRWFQVDFSLLTEAQVEELTDLDAPELPIGSALYIEILRDFTERTGFTVRVAPNLPARWDHIEIVPPDADPVADAAEEWSYAVSYDSDDDSAGALIANAVSVIENDTRFLAGSQTISITPAELGVDFVLGVSRLGEEDAVPVGVRPGDQVDLFGERYVIVRAAHTFGKTYNADLELTPPLL